MGIITDPQKPELVVTYTFTFVFRQSPLQIDVFPKQGDTVTLDPQTGDFRFEFPRLRFSQVVEKANRLTYSCEESERVYIDARVLQKQMVKEIREDLAKRQEQTARG